jgi:short-subunit dehydrogenase
LLANAGRGLGHAFLDQDFKGARNVIDTNVTGTVYLIHRIGRDMRSRNEGRILITGSIAGFMPGSYQAVYNGTKAFLDSFSYALREELKETNVTVTCLMPGATETEFFRRADMLDTKVGAAKKGRPRESGERWIQGDDGWRGRSGQWLAKQVGGRGSARDASREARQEAHRNGGARDGEKIGGDGPP